jgi:hypothetical protein
MVEIAGMDAAGAEGFFGIGPLQRSEVLRLVSCMPCRSGRGTSKNLETGSGPSKPGIPEQIFSVAWPVSASFEACSQAVECGRLHIPLGKGKRKSCKFAAPFK